MKETFGSKFVKCQPNPTQQDNEFTRVYQQHCSFSQAIYQIPIFPFFYSLIPSKYKIKNGDLPNPTPHPILVFKAKEPFFKVDDTLKNFRKFRIMVVMSGVPFLYSIIFSRYLFFPILSSTFFSFLIMLKTNDDKFSGNVWGVVGGKALLLPLQRVFATLNKKEIG